MRVLYSGVGWPKVSKVSAFTNPSIPSHINKLFLGSHDHMEDKFMSYLKDNPAHQWSVLTSALEHFDRYHKRVRWCGRAEADETFVESQFLTDQCVIFGHFGHVPFQKFEGNIKLLSNAMNENQHSI